MKCPEGTEVKKRHVLQALGSFDRLKQAARDWNQLVRGELVCWGFRQSKADPCLYTHAERGTSLLVYVDDIATAAKEQTHID